jgi:hypothetical protein
MTRDLAVRESLRGQRQHHFVYPGQPALALLDDLRLEGAGNVPGHPDLYRPNLGQHGLGAGAVADAAGLLPGGIVHPVTDVVGDLAFQNRLQHPLGQLLQKPTLASQMQALTTGPVDQHRDQLPVRWGRTDRLDYRLFLDRHLTHLTSP